jgi:RimJ/RimL family protein N-acetyltransferase
MLVPLREEDAETLFLWITDRELVELSSRFAPPTPEQHRRWFDEVRSGDDVEIYGIRLVEDEGRLIGSCQLHSIDHDHKSAELQIRIGERDSWGRGLGTEAVTLLVRRAFEGLGLHRVQLQVFATNARAIRAYEKAGFELEGRRRDAAFVGGSYVDVLVMATLRS